MYGGDGAVAGDGVVVGAGARVAGGGRALQWEVSRWALRSRRRITTAAAIRMVMVTATAMATATVVVIRTLMPPHPTGVVLTQGIGHDAHTGAAAMADTGAATPGTEQMPAAARPVAGSSTVVVQEPRLSSPACTSSLNPSAALGLRNLSAGAKMQ